MKEDISIQDILLLIYSKKWIVIFSALIGAILALAYNSSLEKTYTIKLNYYAVDEKEIFPLRKMSSLFEMQRENLGHLENKEIFSINENQILRDYIFILQEKLIDYEKTAIGKSNIFSSVHIFDNTSNYPEYFELNFKTTDYKMSIEELKKLSLLSLNSFKESLRKDIQNIREIIEFEYRNKLDDLQMKTLIDLEAKKNFLEREYILAQEIELEYPEEGIIQNNLDKRKFLRGYKLIKKEIDIIQQEINQFKSDEELFSLNKNIDYNLNVAKLDVFRDKIEKILKLDFNNITYINYNINNYSLIEDARQLRNVIFGFIFGLIISISYVFIRKGFS